MRRTLIAIMGAKRKKKIAMWRSVLKAKKKIRNLPTTTLTSP